MGKNIRFDTREDGLNTQASSHRFVLQQTIDEIQQKALIVDIVGRYAELKRAGSNHKALCPLPGHEERTPSFFVSESKGIFKCFGCGKGGNVFHFIQEMEGIRFVDAVEYLADLCNVTVQWSEPGRWSRHANAHDMLRFAQSTYVTHLERLPDTSPAWTFAASRGLNRQLAAELGIGYAPEEWRFLSDKLREQSYDMELAEELGLVKRNQSGEYYDFYRDRLLFPIIGVDGKHLGFGGRALTTEQPQKYINPRESFWYRKRSHLFGLNAAKTHIQREDHCIIVEGYMDFITLYTAGVRNVVAVLGTALTPFHIELLRRFAKKATLCFDGDKAGTQSMLRALPLCLAKGMNAYAAALPGDHDPDSFVRANGAAPFTAAIAEADSILGFFIGRRLAEDNSEYGRHNVAQEVIAVLRSAEESGSIATGIDQRYMVARAAELLELPESVFYQHLAKTSAEARGRTTSHTASSDDALLHAKNLLLLGLKKPDLLFQMVDDELLGYIADGHAKTALNRLAHMASETGTADAQALIADHDLPDDIRGILSEALLGTDSIADADVETCYEEARGYLRTLGMRGKREELTKLIASAQRDGDIARIKELLAQKQQMDARE